MRKGYKVSGQKMGPKHLESNKQSREMTRYHSKMMQSYTGEYQATKPEFYTFKYGTPRLQKKCPHKRWVNTGYGGPEGGAMGGFCRDCGYSFHTRLY